MKAWASATQEVVRRLTVEADSPASVPKYSARAGRSPWSTVRAGTAGGALGHPRGAPGVARQDHAGEAAPLPDCSSTRRSFTRGATTWTAPATVVTSRGPAW